MLSKEVEHFFHVFIGHLCFFFYKLSTPLLLLVVKFLSSLYILDNSPHQMDSWQSLSPFL